MNPHAQRLLEEAKKKIEGQESRRNSATLSMPWNQSVGDSPDLQRVLHLPRRRWTIADGQKLSEEMTPLLKTDHGTQKLKELQSIGLFEIGTHKKLICTGCAGEGKTLIIFLSAYILRSLRPLVVVPGNLLQKTKLDLQRYAEHWDIPKNLIRIETYEKLSNKNNNDFFDKYRPDSVMFDEAHKLKNTKNSITRRYKRYIHEVRPGTPTGAFSGSLVEKDIKSVWHIFRWILGPENCPLPLDYETLDEWSNAVDTDIGDLNRIDPGQLLKLCSAEDHAKSEGDRTQAARLAIGRRIAETSGIVTALTPYAGASLQIAPIQIEPPENVISAFRSFRKWETPDGHPISDGQKMMASVKSLALGYYSFWDPRPPEEWLSARREFCKLVRQIRANNNRKLDTEAQVVDALEAGHYPKHEPVYRKWREVEPTYGIQRKHVWVSDFAIDAAIAWMKKAPGIVWTRNIPFAERLAEKSGVPYYYKRGYAADGRYIEDHPADQPLIASMASNREGKNLQKWSRNLITNSPSSNDPLEQCIARTHRPGQQADTVYVDVLFVVLEHLVSFHKARNYARFAEAGQQQQQRLLIADCLMPELDDLKPGDIWQVKLFEEQATEDEGLVLAEEE